MTPAAEATCGVCGKTLVEAIDLPPIGACCPECLLTGRVLAQQPALRMAQVAEQLVSLSATARILLAPALEEAMLIENSREFERARECLLRHANALIDQGHPLAAAHLLLRALRLPGQSARVYALLGELGARLDRPREAIQHLKTASWLAIQSRDQALAERVLSALTPLAPADPWLPKARDLLAASVEAGEGPRCKFCGRGTIEAGPLIVGGEAAICAACVKRMMMLDGGEGSGDN